MSLASLSHLSDYFSLSSLCERLPRVSAPTCAASPADAGFYYRAVQKLNLKSPEPGWDNNSVSTREGTTPTLLVSFPGGGYCPPQKPQSGEMRALCKHTGQGRDPRGSPKSKTWLVRRLKAAS